MTGLVRELATEPRWIINATTYETGKNWRFMPQRMGDYQVGYVADPPIPVADAVAASAGFPGLIGPLVLRTRDFSWSRYVGGSPDPVPAAPPALPRLHLWDGGVYDNLGVEALFKTRSERFREGYNFLIVSDASGTLPVERPLPHRRAKRLVDIATDQVRGLRSRSLVEHFTREPNSGVYLRMGRTASYLLREAGVPEAAIAPVAEGCLAEPDALAAAALGTHLRRLSERAFDRVYRHGWEVADCTLGARCPGLFRHRPWCRVGAVS